MCFIEKSKKYTLHVLVFALKMGKVAIIDNVKILPFWTKKTAKWARYVFKFIVQRGNLVEGVYVTSFRAKNMNGFI